MSDVIANYDLPLNGDGRVTLEISVPNTGQVSEETRKFVLDVLEVFGKHIASLGMAGALAGTKPAAPSPLASVLGASLLAGATRPGRSGG